MDRTARAPADTFRRPPGALRHQWKPPANDNLAPLARRIAVVALSGLVLATLALLAMGLMV